IARIGDQRRSLQQGADRGNVGAFKSDLGEAVLGDLHRGASGAGLLLPDLHLGGGEAGIVSNDDRGGGLEALLQLRHLLGFCRSFHKLSPVDGSRRCADDEPSVATCRLDPYATCGDRDDAWCPAPGADTPHSRSNGSNRSQSGCPAALGLTRLCRRSIKPAIPAPAVLDRTRLSRKLRSSPVPSDVPEDVQKEWVPD